MTARKRIGILALQGAFSEHSKALHRLGADTFEIRSLKDLQGHMDGLVLPGGESTTQGKLLHRLGLFDPLLSCITEGLPMYGTCAGLILLAGEIENDHRTHFGLMDITVKRNAYGRQLGSFFTRSSYEGKEIPMSFIRAPYIAGVGAGVEVLAEVDGHIVAARQRNMLVTAFHPEITDDGTVHQSFMDMLQ